MPRYYFDIRDGDGTHVDETGLDLRDMRSAVEEARRALAEMRLDVISQEDTQDIEILIRDGDDGPVRLRLSLRTERPAD
jgi:hypothetical protein